MNRELATLLVVLSLNYVCAFNIDVNNPIIYEDPFRNISGRKTYFGYTVLLNGIYGWFLIGAPRSNSSVEALTDVNEPGVVYKCKLMGPCKEMELDNVGNGKPESRGEATMKDLKDHAWIGGAMDAEMTVNGRVVICAPRWVNQLYEKDKEYFMTGLCYCLYNDDTDRLATRLIPTISHDKAIFTVSQLSQLHVYYYGLSQAGMSVHLMSSEEPMGMILGAPGLFNWRGGLVEYLNRDPFENTGRNRRSTPKKSFIPDKNNVINPYYADQIHDFDLFGYQVTSGHFFGPGKRYYVASAPRGNSMTGYVTILQFPEYVFSRSRWVIFDRKQGKEFGEYFGYSLAVGKFSRSDCDDLVVGAPMYSNGGTQREIGRIYVFLGSKSLQLQVPENGNTIDGSWIDGRFGSAVASLGDIDQDGYDDLAVGAPYEVDRRGAIYIYNGGEYGLNTKPSQRIAASDVDSSLRGFGISIAFPQDMDSNNYNDVAVGAYLSGHAVLFRTYPVVSLQLSVKPSVYLLRSDSKDFSLRICHAYDGENAPDTINVRRHLIIDEEYNRATFEGSEKNITLLQGVRNCDDVHVKINSSEERMEEVKITVSQSVVERRTKRNAIWILPNNSRAGDDTFCENCPVVKKSKSQMDSTVNLRYARDCDPCRSDLHLSADLFEVINKRRLNGEYVFGSGKTIRLVMNILNSGDVSYGTYVTVDLPDNVNIANLPLDCKERSDKKFLSIKCDFDKALRQGVNKTIPLDLDMSYAEKGINVTTGIAPDLVFAIRVNDSSEVKNFNDNYRSLTLKLKTKADVIIIGQSGAEYYSYIIKDGNDATTDLNKTFEQKYKVIKVGPSPIQKMHVTFHVPLIWKEGRIEFLKMYQPDVKLGGQLVTCKASENFNFLWDEIVVNTDNDLQQGPGRTKRSVNATHLFAEGDKTVTLKNNGFDQYPSNRSLYLNCSMHEVICGTIQCTATKFDVQFLEVELKMVVNISLLGPLMTNKDIVHVSTEGSVEIIIPNNLKHNDTNGSQKQVVTSTFIGSLPEKKVDLWIIIVAVVGGILLLLLIILGLVKAGFFRRKKKEELLLMKNPEDKDS